MATIWNRVNTLLLLLVLFSLLGVLAMLAAGVRGGPLDPAGPPDSTPGVLAPGTPITSLPYTIGAPGHYYLTGNLEASSATHGISIESDGVTIDLGGFELNGGGTGLDGIHTSNGLPADNVTIRNGSIFDWENEGIDLFFSNNALVENVHVSKAGFVGIKGGVRGIVRECTVRSTGIAGIYVEDGIVTDCQVESSENGIQSQNGSYIHHNKVSLIADPDPFEGVAIMALGAGNRIEDNIISASDVGVITSANDNLMKGNLLYDIAEFDWAFGSADQMVGPFITGGAIATETNPYVNFTD